MVQIIDSGRGSFTIIFIIEYTRKFIIVYKKGATR